MSNNKTKITLERAYDIIKKPITTEKSTNLQQFNQYSFIVLKNSNSYEIKSAIEISKICGFRTLISNLPESESFTVPSSL